MILWTLRYVSSTNLRCSAETFLRMWIMLRWQVYYILHDTVWLLWSHCEMNVSADTWFEGLRGHMLSGHWCDVPLIWITCICQCSDGATQKWTPWKVVKKHNNINLLYWWRIEDWQKDCWSFKKKIFFLNLHFNNWQSVWKLHYIFCLWVLLQPPFISFFNLNSFSAEQYITAAL